MVARYVTQKPDVTLSRLGRRKAVGRVDNLMATNCCVGQRCQWPLLIITASVEMETAMAKGNY